MFGISLGELLVIAIIGLIVIKPDDLPVYLKQIRGFYKKFLEFREKFNESKKDLEKVIFEDEELKNYRDQFDAEIKTIIGDDGKKHISYPEFIRDQKKID